MPDSSLPPIGASEADLKSNKAVKIHRGGNGEDRSVREAHSELAADYQRAHKLAGVPTGSIVRPRQ